MSPASQGNLEVERYIGSCLISSSLRVNNTSGKGNNTSNNNNYKGKKVIECGSHRSGKLQNSVSNHRVNNSGNIAGGGGNSGGNCQDHHFSQLTARGFPSPGTLIPLCECGGLKFGGAQYGSPGPNAGVGGSWAGLPLISMAPSNSRRNRKPSTSSTGSSNNSNHRNAKNPSGPQSQPVVPGTNCGKSNGDIEHGSQQSRSPLSRLAIHTQGAPLILAGRYNASGRKNNVNHNKGPPVRQFRGGDVSVRRSNSVRDTRDTSSTAIIPNGSNGNTPNSDCLSVASDESSGHSENSLPRIIKPRKRRKKDRKPPPQNNPSLTDNPNSNTPSELKNIPLEPPNIVTLKPYVPVCYELYDNGRWNGNRRSVNKEDAEGRVKPWEVENKHSFILPYTIEVPRDEEQVSQTSEDDNQEPKLHHNFDDVEEDEGLHVETGPPFSYPCPPTLCQCRYCDPSGLIWDVDQHCYSPFLTPPSPTAEKPFANIPLFLTPPPTEVRSFDFLNKDVRSSSSVFLTDNEHPSSLLRRSWSEPLPSTLRSGSVVSQEQDSHGHFGVIGRGRVTSEERESNLTNIHAQKNTSSEISPVNITVSTSQSLEVSTEIVTSPNGHRDIEIKFYSSSPPAGTALVCPGEIRNAPLESGSDDKTSEDGRTSSSSQDEQVDRQEMINRHENTQQELKDGYACVQSAGIDEQGGSSLAGVKSGKISDREVKSGILDKIPCEQSAKKLGKEVNHFRLHAEE